MDINNNFLYTASLKTKDGTKWGYINETGEFEIKPHFDFANDFQSNGLAIVKTKQRYGGINVKGNFVIPPKFESINEFSEGRATVVLDNGFHVIDERGLLLNSKPFNFISMYQDGRALFSDIDTDGKFKYGYLNKAGNVVIPLQYEMASDFKDGMAVVKIKEDTFSLIDINGNEIKLFFYNYVGNYGENMLSFRKSVKGKYGYVNTEGTIVIQPSFTSAQPFENGRAVVNAAEDFGNKFGLINKKGAYIIKPIYNDITILGEHRVAVGKAIDEQRPYLGSKYAVANWKGEVLTAFKYNHISLFDQGIASVSEDEKAYFIDRSGNRARGLPVVKNADSVTLVGKLIRVLENTRVSYVDRKGKLIWKQNTIIPLTKRYRILEKKYKPNKDYVVYYPQLDGLKIGVIEMVVNKRLKLLSKLKKIKQNEQLDYSYNGDFNVTFFKKNLLVIELYGYEYYFGAAHGMPNKTFVNINLINGRFYELENLFKKDSDYVERLSEIIRHMIKTDPKYDYVFPGAYKGISKNQPFYVEEEFLVIYFEPYEIGPYAAGFPTFKIPFLKIIDIIDKKGEFWLSFH
ncbi:hypothetical protein BKP45_00210 [Anaerobacillus alkalidiazotrophicus]|uniref:DUF3298 domain-containing protein n=1 Tax=Anaerobacillus alkalidiazotrophicus TaxID=472963 RepID=A0A1S2M9S9_9BACI|nr:WG repeat-containing protein [Anaerobacillus alkalidiazotrophicus]OIJ21243.1 hypothetical protein BKP45_00210 [Anaerobacillus alkalidiazotrophicus]